MRIVVCVKQVPNTNEIKINPETGTLIRDGVESILNHDDANALEQALQIKDDQPDTVVTVVTMGPPQAKEMLQECIAMGADEAILLSDRALGGSDTCATSNALAAGIKTLGDFDLIFAGRQAIDGDTAQVGPQIAEKLGLPQVTYVKEFRMDGKDICVKRALEDGYEELKLQMPCVLTEHAEIHEHQRDTQSRQSGYPDMGCREDRRRQDVSGTQSVTYQRVQIIHTEAEGQGDHSRGRFSKGTCRQSHR